MEEIFKELVVGSVRNDEFNPEAEIFRSCMRSFFRDKHGNDPLSIRRLYKERIIALHKVKNYQISHTVQSVESPLSLRNDSEISLNYSRE